jgi:hypothetical protein
MPGNFQYFFVEVSGWLFANAENERLDFRE